MDENTNQKNSTDYIEQQNIELRLISAIFGNAKEKIKEKSKLFDKKQKSIISNL